MPKGSVCAEIGVFKGDFSEDILSVVQPIELHLIDPWKYEDDIIYSTSMYGKQMATDQTFMDEIYESVQDRFFKQVKSGVISIHRLPSDKAAESFKDDYLDWVYIDGNHQYEYVKNDLENFYQKVKPGGLLACDDYGVKGWWGDGILKAVHEFLVNYDCKVEFMAGTQFVIKKTS